MLEANIPAGPFEQKWDNGRFDMKLVNPVNRRSTRSSSWAQGWLERRRPLLWANKATASNAFPITTPRVARTPLQPKGESTPPRTTATTATAFSACLRTQARAATFARAKPMCIVSPKSVSTSSTNASLKACRSSGSTAGFSTLDRLAACKSNERFMREVRRDSSSYWAPIRPWKSSWQLAVGTMTMHIRSELLDVVIVNGTARGIVTRDLVTGQIECHAADVIVLATGGYSNAFYLSTNAKACNCTAIWRAHRRGALFGNPCFTQIHPTCIPLSSEHQSKLTLMSESLRNDGRIWVPKKKGDTRAAKDIPENERDYYLESRYPSFGKLVPRDVASRNAQEVCDEGRGVGPHGHGVYLDFADAIRRLGLETVREKYGNLFDSYERITGEDAYNVPMRIYPAPHFTMGGLWVDYHLMSTIPGLFVGGEANFSDHGANRLGF